MTTGSIHIRAGNRAYEIIRDGGFDFDRVTAYFAPATGPRWLAATGFDLALLTNDLLGRVKPVLLLGASAGAWRFAAWLQPEAEKSYRTLIEKYISISYKRNDTPSTVLDSLKAIINAYIEDDALPFALANKKYRFAVITARTRHLLASEIALIQRIGLWICFLSNAISRTYIHDFAERVVFYNGAKPPYFCLRPEYHGKFIPLSNVNFKHAIMASGAIPLVVAGIRDIYGAPVGVYRDGGLIDYHLTHNYASSSEDIVLFFNHQKRIIPGWLDKKLSYRHPQTSVLDNVLMIYPSDTFVAGLPGGKVPDRDDFTTFIDDESTRIKNWWRTVECVKPLGENFIELVESTQLRNVVEKLEIQ